MVLALGLCLPTMCNAQKKEISKAKDNVKAGKSLEEAETSMRKLLTDSANKDNEKIWLILFDAVRKQYETVNEQMYLRNYAMYHRMHTLELMLIHFYLRYAVLILETH